MRRLAASALCLMILTACETTSGGVPPPPLGASSFDVEPGRTRVTYRGTKAMSEAEVRDRALLAAAEGAIARGYDWFQVTDRTTDLLPNRGPRFSIGLGTGSFGRHSAFGLGTSTSFGGGGGSLVVSLEVVAGRGTRPTTPDVYDARSVADTLRRQLPLG